MIIGLVSPSNYNQDISHGFHINCIIHGLRELGHNVYFSWDKRVIVPNLEILINPFLFIKLHKEYIKEIIKSKIPYIIYSTEILRSDLSGFNFEMRDDFTAEEKDIFFEFCSKALKILTPSGDNFAYEKLNSKVITSRVGYIPSLPVIRRAVKPNFDVVFFGSMNATRDNFFQELTKANIKFAVLGYCHALLRDCFVANSKAILNLNHSIDEWKKIRFEQKREYIPLPSSLPFSPHRLIQALHNKMLCLSDLPESGDDYYKPFFHSFSKGNGVELIKSVTQSDAWRDLGENYSDKFSKSTPYSVLLNKYLSDI